MEEGARIGARRGGRRRPRHGHEQLRVALLAACCYICSLPRLGLCFHPSTLLNVPGRRGRTQLAAESLVPVPQGGFHGRQGAMRQSSAPLYQRRRLLAAQGKGNTSHSRGGKRVGVAAGSGSNGRASGTSSESQDLSRGVKVFEVELRRPLDFKILPGDGGAGVQIVGVKEGGNAASVGLRDGDMIVATSATMGDQLWKKRTVEGVASALRTRFMLTDTARLRIERNLSEGDIAKARFVDEVTHTLQVTLQKPPGIFLAQQYNEDGSCKGVYICGMVPGGPAERSGLVQVGDRIAAVSNTFGSKMWEYRMTQGVVSALSSGISNTATMMLERTASLGPWRDSAIDSASISETLAGYRLIRDTDEAAEAASPTKMQSALSNGLPMVGVGVGGKGGETPSASSSGISDANVVVRERCIKLLESYTRVRRGEAVAELMAALKKVKHVPDNRLLNAAMVSAVACGVPELAITFFQDRLDAGLLPNLRVCTTLIKAHGVQGSLKEALAVLKSCASWGLEPDTAMVNAAISACLAAGRTDQAWSFYRRLLPALKLRPSVRTFNILLDGLSEAHDVQGCMLLYREMISQGIQPNEVTMTTIMKAQLERGLMEDAEETLRRMQVVHGLQLDIFTYNNLIRGQMRTLRWREALATKDAMLEAGVTPDVLTYSYIFTGLTRSGMPGKVKPLWREALSLGIKPNVYMYTGKARALAALGDVLEAIEMLGEMKEVNVRPNVRTFTAVMLACLEGGRPETVLDLYREMRKAGEKQDTVTGTLVIRAFCDMGQIDQAFRTLNAMERSTKLVRGNPWGVRARRVGNNKPNVLTYTYLLEECIRSGAWEDATKCFTKMIKFGVVPNANTYRVVAMSSQEPRTGDRGRRIEFMVGIMEMAWKRRLSVASSLYAAVLRLCLDAQRAGGEGDFLPLAVALVESRKTRKLYIQAEDRAEVKSLERSVQKLAPVSEES
jgi:pentatricopeptide repeat protein